MKKINLIFAFILLIVVVGCGRYVKVGTIPKVNIVKNSNLVDVKVDKVVNPHIFLTITNKSEDIVELLILESSINNKPIFDGKEIDSVKLSNNFANLGNAFAGFGGMMGSQPTYEKAKIKKLENKLGNVILNPKEEFQKYIGSDFEVEFPIKIVLKVQQKNIVEYVSLVLEDTNNKIEVDGDSYDIIVSETKK